MATKAVHLVEHVTQEVTPMPRGRRPKTVKAPNRLERCENIRQRILSLASDLVDDGLGGVLAPPAPVKTISNPIRDPKTGGWIAHVEEPLATYIQRVSVADNFSQRPPFDHVEDPIYRRLIRDFLQGAAMPESKVAALSSGKSGRKAESLQVPDVSYSVIDGLQRLYCYCIAVLLVWLREQTVQEGLITKEAWNHFAEILGNGAGDSHAATEELLKRSTRYEIFYNIDLGGLLHYMVTFNTGQRRMSLDVQLEIMRRPLIDELESNGIPVWHDIQSMPGMKQPKDKFAAADLVLATEAFITNNAQLTQSTEAERFLNENQAYLDNVGDINDVAQTLKRITTEIHPEIMRVYADDPSRRYILSGGTFLLSFAAACGYVRNRGNMKILDGALDKLMVELKKPEDDPLNLDDYQKALSQITSSRGKATRRLVYDTFLRFFNGVSTELEWLDTATQITGVAF